MYNPQLDAFIAAADSGSFSKAADKLFISAPAVIKQINALERHLDVKLFDRSPRGISLTDAGKSIYSDAQKMKRASDKAIAKAHGLVRSNASFIRIGSSLMNPCKKLMDRWREISSGYPQFKMQIVPYDDSASTVLGVFDSLGERFDLIVSPCNSREWLRHCTFYPFERLPVCCAVPQGHRLERRSVLTPSDLAGETILMMKAGDSPILDEIRSVLMQNCPGISILDSDYYDASVLNRCEQEGCILLTLSVWEDIHPFLTTIPVDWDFTMPYGLICAKEPSPEVRIFAEAIVKMH